MGIIGLMLSLGWRLDFTMAYLNSYSGLVIASIAIWIWLILHD